MSLWKGRPFNPSSTRICILITVAATRTCKAAFLHSTFVFLQDNGARCLTGLTWSAQMKALVKVAQPSKPQVKSHPTQKFASMTGFGRFTPHQAMTWKPFFCSRLMKKY